MSVNVLDRARRTDFVWRLSGGPILLATVIVGLSLWLFWDGLWLLGAGWASSPEYSHCVLIPPIAAFLIWQQRDRLERLPFEGSWWGVGLVLLGGALLVLGQLATIYTLVQYAYLVTLYGLVLSFTGRRAFRLLGVPLLILAFMIPLPAFFLYNLSTKLQLLSSELGVWFMRLFGISVFVEGGRSLRWTPLPIPIDDARVLDCLLLQGRTLEESLSVPVEYSGNHHHEQLAHRHHRTHGGELGHRHG
jgi:hypothetical protein